MVWTYFLLRNGFIRRLILMLRLVLQSSISTVISAYVQLRPTDKQENRFYETLLQTTLLTNDNDLFMVGDFNRKGVQQLDDCQGVHGDYGVGSHNEERIRLQEFCNTNNQLLSNTNFRKPTSHIFTYQPGGNTIQIDYILTRKDGCS